MTEVRKANDAAGFLSMVPAMLGYQPTESVVAVLFTGNRSAGAMRVDVPVPGNEAAFASTLAGLVCRVEHADSVVLVQYTDLIDTRAVFERTGEVIANQCGMPIRDSLYVSSTGYGSHFEDAGPHPLSDLHVPDDLARMVRDGDQANVAFPEPVDGVREILSTLDPAADIDPELVTFLEDAVAVPGWDTDQAPLALAILTWSLNRPAIRDIALVQWSKGQEFGVLALMAQMAWEQGVEYPAELAMTMWGEGDQPDPKRLERALTACLTAANSVSLADSVGPLATAAWLSWALGRSTHAEKLAKKALAVEPGHGLSEIIESFVNAGHLPNWAFQSAR